MSVQCKMCNKDVEPTQAKETYDEVGQAMCKSCAKKYLNGENDVRESEENEATTPTETQETPAHSDMEQEDYKITDVAVEQAKYPRRPITCIKGMPRQLCERGHIKIGKKGKMTTSNRGTLFRPPEKLDHFVVTTMNRTGEDDFETDENIMRILGDRPQEIPVTLVYDSPDLNFPTCYAYYDSAQCQCRGDGEYAITVDGRQIQCNPETCKNATSKKCKPNGVLSVILTNAPGVGGVYKFRTTGWNSIRNLMSSIEFIHGLVGGRLAGLPLMLTLHPKTTVIPGTKTPTTIYMVNLEYRGTIDELMHIARNRLISSEKMQEIEEKAVGMLAEPESVEECKDIQEEFYPETIRGA